MSKRRVLNRAAASDEVVSSNFSKACSHRDQLFSSFASGRLRPHRHVRRFSIIHHLPRLRGDFAPDGIPCDHGMPVCCIERGMERMGTPTRERGIEMSEVFADDAVLVRRIHIVSEAHELIEKVATVERVELRQEDRQCPHLLQSPMEFAESREAD